MSSKKITWHNSGDIADKIANKAFEHLINPIMKQMREVAASAIRVKIEELGGLKKLKECGFIYFADMDCEETFEFIPRTYTIPNDEEIEILCFAGFTTRSGKMYIIDDRAYEMLHPFREQLAPFEFKRNALRETIKKQIEDKSVSTVKKAWPEAAGIIDEVLGITDKPEITRPLEELLARFLPLLPAPHSEGV